jgi:hypothetical protein
MLTEAATDEVPTKVIASHGPFELLPTGVIELPHGQLRAFADKFVPVESATA